MLRTLFTVRYYSLLILLTGCCFIFLAPAIIHAQVIPGDPGNFITTWNTENNGNSNNNQITLSGSGGGYNYEIYWENIASSTINGATSLITTNSYTLTFPEPGIYVVQASGTIPTINFSVDQDKILTIEQWGNNPWSNMTAAFQDCSNLRIPAIDAPNLSGVTSMVRMFHRATAMNDPINHWDVSNVTDMRGVFWQAYSFNQPLDNWDVSNVMNMGGMFWQAYSFNQPLDNWDVSKVTIMESLFNQARDFNQPLNSWVTSSTTNMVGVFLGTSFNQPLDNWDVSNVETMRVMFRRSPFNQDLSTWDIARVTNMTNMFGDTSLSTFNQDNILQSWSQQTLQPNVPFHIGLKNYSQTGAAALQTLRDTYNWTITEQYRAEYRPSPDATLFGSSIQSPLDSGATTTTVEIDPKNSCTFIKWSDGNTDNPRTDVLTDNLSVTAELRCVSQSGGTSAARQIQNLEAMGKYEEAQALKDRFGDTTPPSTTNPPSLADTLDTVQAFINNPAPISPSDRNQVQELIRLLLELVQALGKMLLLQAMAD